MISKIDWTVADQKLKENNGDSAKDTDDEPAGQDRIEESGNQFEVRELNRIVKLLKNGIKI